jgi:hypothetical protein
MRNGITRLMQGMALAALTLAPAGGAQAATHWLNGTVGAVSCVAAGGYCSVILTSTPPAAGRPTCAGTDPSLVINTATAAGDGALKLVLAAKAAGWSISLHGKGTCVVNTFQEDLDWVQVQ